MTLPDWVPIPAWDGRRPLRKEPSMAAQQTDDTRPERRDGRVTDEAFSSGRWRRRASFALMLAQACEAQVRPHRTARPGPAGAAQPRLQPLPLQRPGPSRGSPNRPTPSRRRCAGPPSANHGSGSAAHPGPQPLASQNVAAPSSAPSPPSRPPSIPISGSRHLDLADLRLPDLLRQGQQGPAEPAESWDVRTMAPRWCSTCAKASNSTTAASWSRRRQVQHGAAPG